MRPRLLSAGALLALSISSLVSVGLPSFARTQRVEHLADKSRLVVIDVVATRRTSQSADLAAEYEPLRRLGRLAIFREGEIAFADPALTLRTVFVDNAFYSTLGMNPLTGRLPMPGSGGSSEVVVSASLWKRLGSQPVPFDLIGKQVVLRAVGVIDSNSNFPNGVDLWSSTAALRFGWVEGGPFSAVIHLTPGITLNDVRSELRRLGRNSDSGRALVRPVGDSIREKYDKEWMRLSRPLLLFVFFSLVASILMWQQDFRRRTREFFIRSALGATRFTLVSSAALEILRVDLCAAIAGWAIGRLAATAVTKLGPDPIDLPTSATVLSLGGCVLAAAVLTAVTTAVAVVPAVPVGKLEPQRRLRAETLLLAVQFALLFLFMIGTDSAVRQAIGLLHVDLGFGRTGAVVADVILPRPQYDGAPLRRQLWQRLIDQATSGSDSASLEIGSLAPSLTWRPLESAMIHSGSPTDNDGIVMEIVVVSSGFLEGIGAHLSAGEFAKPGGLPSPIVINEAATDVLRAHFGTALGGQLFLGSIPVRVAGVVRNVLWNGQGVRPPPTAFVAFQNWDPPAKLSVVVWHSSGAALATKELREALASVDASLSVSTLRTLDGVSRQIQAGPLFLVALAILIGAGAFYSGLLAAYASASLAAAAAERDNAIRAALGASTFSLQLTIVFRIATAAVVGCAIAATWSLLMFKVSVQAIEPGMSVSWSPIIRPFVATVCAVWLGCAGPCRRLARLDLSRILQGS